METRSPLSRNAGIPLREQVRMLLSGQIENGTLQPGDRLPTEAQLAEELRVSLSPIRAALSDLADAGMIRRQAGLGTFVTGPAISVHIDLLPSFTDTLRAAGVSFTTEMVRRASGLPPETVRARLALSHGQECVELRRVATVEGRRAVVLDSWFPLPRFARLLEDSAIDEPQRSVYAYLSSEFDLRLTAGSGQLSVSACGDDLLPLLDVQFGAPIVKVETFGTDEDGEVVEVTNVHYDASRFVFNINTTAG